MLRLPLIRAIPLVAALVIAATAAFASAVFAAPPPLVAQVGTTVVPNAPSGSVVSGTAPAASPAIPATANAPSAVVPPSAPPPIPPSVETGGGIDRGALIETLIGVAAAIVLVPLGAWGLIRLIANAGR